jgi:hypothetical protein
MSYPSQAMSFIQLVGINRESGTGISEGGGSYSAFLKKKLTPSIR